MISIIIPTCNRPEMLATCIDLLLCQIAVENEAIELVVTDDGAPSDYVKELTEAQKIVYVRGPQRGPAANRNAGARAACGSELIFIDDDCIPASQFISSYRTAFRYSDIAVFEGRVLAECPRSSLAQVAPLNENGGFLWSCNFAVRSSLFKELGGFDERFPYAAMEDVEFRYRLKKREIPFQFIKDAVVTHPWRQRGDWNSFQRHFESTCIYLSIHPEERKHITFSYYLRLAAIGFVRDTLPQATKYRGRGFLSALREHLAFVYAGVRLLRA